MTSDNITSASGNLVLQQGPFWHKHCCLHHRHVGYVHSQQLCGFKTASNLNNQVHRYLDHLWHGSSFCHHYPYCIYRTSPRNCKPCFCWKFPKGRNPNAKNKRCYNFVGTKGFTDSWNCFYHMLFYLCLDNIYLLE